jgi:hypothetical protein
MYKLITFVLAAAPIVLFVKVVFLDRSKKWSKAVADFKQQLDLLVTIMLVMFACALVYSIVKLVLS